MRENADIALGTSIDVVRTVAPQARRVVVVGGERLDIRHLARSLRASGVRR